MIVHKVLMRIGLATCVTSAISCSSEQSGSDVKVVNGQLTEEYPEVAAIRIGNSGLCTGTFVSSNTMITAAHCLSGPIYVNERRASLVLASPYATGQVGPGDLGVVVWNDGIAPAVAQLFAQPPRPGDQLTIVGYGLNDLRTRSGAGRKRVGTNTVTRVSSGMIQFQAYQGERKAVSGSGDSGGPLFINGKLAGVTSGGAHFGGFKESMYVDLSSQMSQAFLRDAVRRGAVIPGIGGSPAASAQPLAPESSLTSAQSRGPQTSPPALNVPPRSVSTAVPSQPSDPSSASNTVPSIGTPQWDCNRDYQRIRQSRSSGVCLNSTSGLCYRFGNGDVQYALGRVACGS